MPIVHWFRRDFRIHDNTALRHACRDSADGVVPVFVFDDAILRHPDCGAPIVRFMLDCLAELRDNLRADGGDIILMHGKPVQMLREIARQTAATAVYYNKDYAPAAVERDEEVERLLGADGIDVKGFKDQVIFEEQEILTAGGGLPYTVYTPYKNAWLKRFRERGIEVLGKPKMIFAKPMRGLKSMRMPSAAELGFESKHRIDIEAGEGAALRRLGAFCSNKLKDYQANRDFPAIDGSSRLSPHLRHGTISPRQCLNAALKTGSKGADAWVAELIWRDFFQQVLFNFPHVEKAPFKRNFRKLKWRRSDADWKRWTDGITGYPIVDAAMRQLNQTGWMHNRLRMVVSMFLAKDLFLDYRLGERYFMRNLIDGETAQNNGGWQWSAGTGTDAQPYFRVFNPTAQGKKFDPKGAFIRRYCPELERVTDQFIHCPHEMPTAEQQRVGCRIGIDYPAQMVDHAKARLRAINRFRAVAKNSAKRPS
ncbi:MAG TPA: deoxyribodipyrimidine photo-lyase [Tepidisphaeraceae bacterium]|nr:deoxyribodipyrimidine photo-lyase [Tepidisphaeraceae bacterium]